MALEIERKFLIDPEKWKPSGEGTRMVQAYLSVFPNPTVRVRIAGQQAFLTIKGNSETIARPEYEYEIPVADAEEMISLAVSRLVEKTRYTTDFEGLCWEIDVFSGENTGLMLAEIELKSTDQVIKLPDWIRREVTPDRRYYNSFLSEHPYSEWNPAWPDF